MSEKVTAVFNCEKNESGAIYMEATNDADKYPSFVESTCGQIDLNIWNHDGAKQEVVDFFQPDAVYRVTFERIDE